MKSAMKSITSMKSVPSRDRPWECRCHGASVGRPESRPAMGGDNGGGTRGDFSSGRSNWEMLFLEENPRETWGHLLDMVDNQCNPPKKSRRCQNLALQTLCFSGGKYSSSKLMVN